MLGGCILVQRIIGAGVLPLHDFCEAKRGNNDNVAPKKAELRVDADMIIVGAPISGMWHGVPHTS